MLLLLLLHEPDAHLLLGLKSLLNLINYCDGLWLKRRCKESFKTLHIAIVLCSLHCQVEVDYVQELLLQEIYLLKLDATNVAEVAIEIEGVSVVFVCYQNSHQDQPVNRQRVD